MLWSQPIAKHVYNYIDIYIHYTHTEAGFTIKTELLHQTSSHWNCWLDTLTQWFIYDSFMAPNRRIPYCWVVASFGPTKKGDLEPNNVQIQTKASSRDYNFTSISLIISDYLCLWFGFVNSKLWLFRGNKTHTNTTSLRFFVSTFRNNQCSSNIPKISQSRTFHPRDFPCWSAVSHLRRVVIPFKAAAHVMVGASMAHMFFG
jgi:hypothetical protein